MPYIMAYVTISSKKGAKLSVGMSQTAFPEFGASVGGEGVIFLKPNFNYVLLA